MKSERSPVVSWHWRYGYGALERKLYNAEWSRQLKRKIHKQSKR